MLCGGEMHSHPQAQGQCQSGEVVTPIPTTERETALSGATLQGSLQRSRANLHLALR